ncbi:hypothetical protein LguiB_015423 [Lonicera macranthoides]
MGSAKSGILGEATVNLAGYASSKASVVVSLPLKKCNYGTILQVEIQCLTPRTIVRNEKCRGANPYNANADYDDVDSRSDMSDNSSFNKSVGSSSSNHFSGSSRAGELGGRETSFSISGSRPSVDSMDSTNSMRRQDSSDSQNSASYGAPYPVSESPQSNRRHQREDFGRISHASPLRNAGGSSEEVVNIEELRAEASMWERNARNLQTEHDGLKQEIEQLQVLLEESTAKQKLSGNSKIKAEDNKDIHKELEREIMFQKESNDNLAEQLKKAQDSNLELVSYLQEMEETIENQKTEIESLLNSKSDNKEAEWRRRLAVKEKEIANLEAKLLEFASVQDSKLSESENRGDLDQNKEIKALREKVRELENDCAELTDENLELLMKLKESNKDLSSNGASCNSSFKDGPPDDSSTSIGPKLVELNKRETPDDNLQIRCNDLQSKVEELELQLQEFKTLSEEQENEIVALLQLLENQKTENSGNPTGTDAEEKVTKDLAVEDEKEGDYLKGNISCSSCRGLESLIEELKANLLLKEEEIEALESGQRDLENQISDLENIEETIEIIQREGEEIAKRNVELESCKNELEQNLCELEEENARLSQRVSDLESQLRYLTDSRESESNAMNLQDEIRRLKNEMVAQREDMRNKLVECSSLQKSNGELREQRVQLGEEIAVLKDQLEKMPILQDETLALKSSLNEMKTENERLKVSLESVSGAYEESKPDKSSMEDRMNSQLCANVVELKNELRRIEGMNSELQLKIKCLEEEKEVWVNKVETLEEELKQKKGGGKEEQTASAAKLNDAITREEVKLSEEDDNKQKNDAGSPQEMAHDYVSRIQILENELAEAVEANDMYKAQLKSLLAEGQTAYSVPPKNKKTKGNTINRGENENEDKLSLLEAELNDIRERYLNMSLKYAEVEEQREKLVLKLKNVHDGGRWKWFK